MDSRNRKRKYRRDKREIFPSEICKLTHRIRGLTIRQSQFFCRKCPCACRSYSSQLSSHCPPANPSRARSRTLPNPVQNRKKMPFHNHYSLLRMPDFQTQPAPPTIYLESFARLAGRVIGVARTAQGV